MTAIHNFIVKVWNRIKLIFLSIFEIDPPSTPPVPVEPKVEVVTTTPQPAPKKSRKNQSKSKKG
jgi:hypothetical protein